MKHFLNSLIFILDFSKLFNLGHQIINLLNLFFFRHLRYRFNGWHIVKFWAELGQITKPFPLEMVWELLLVFRGMASWLLRCYLKLARCMIHVGIERGVHPTLGWDIAPSRVHLWLIFNGYRFGIIVLFINYPSIHLYISLQLIVGFYHLLESLSPGLIDRGVPLMGLHLRVNEGIPILL